MQLTGERIATEVIRVSAAELAPVRKFGAPLSDQAMLITTATAPIARAALFVFFHVTAICYRPALSEASMN
jgi:hypothetical protein